MRSVLLIEKSEVDSKYGKILIDSNPQQQIKLLFRQIHSLEDRLLTC